MATSPLTTKLEVVLVGTELASRPCLIERLNAGLDHKLTLFSAPAGLGKTMLRTEWATVRSQDGRP